MGPTRGCGNGCRCLLAIVLVAGAADFAAAQQGSSSGPGPNNFHPSKLTVFVILVIGAMFLGLSLGFFIRRCAGGPLGAGRAGGITFATGAARSRRMKGLNPAVLAAFPTMAYADVKAHKAGKGTLECAVCLSEFGDDETLRILPKCSHAFHIDCIDTWLKSQVTCPVCRANLDPDAEAPTAVNTAVSTTMPAQEASAAPEVTVVVVAAEEPEEERSPS